jgi:hypothetical protein
MAYKIKLLSPALDQVTVLHTQPRAIPGIVLHFDAGTVLGRETTLHDAVVLDDDADLKEANAEALGGAVALAS